MATTTRPADPMDVRRLAGRLKLVTDRTRVGVLMRLDDDELSVGALGREVSFSLSSLSNHLALLRTAGLVASRPASKWRVYRLTDEGRALLRVVEALAGGG
jgi:DNA-binding transcriptional ArsR family regulator